MRYLTLSDFTRTANKADIMSSVAEFKIPKGMVYQFSTRQNMSLFIQEVYSDTGDGSTVAFTLTSAPVQCPDLGGSATAGEDMKNQIVAYTDGSVVTDWDINWATGVITYDAAPGNTLQMEIFYCSTLNGSPALADGSAPGVLEIRAEAPSGQNLAIPIFSGMLDQIMGNVQNSDLTPLRLEGAVLLPEGFVLAVKINANKTALAGTEVVKTGEAVFSTTAYAAERVRIPYERYALRDFPRDFKAKVLASMAVS